MALKLLNRVGMFITTTGTGSVTADTLISNRFLTPAEAGATNGDESYWLLEEGSDFELFRGTLTGTTVSRDTVIVSKISGTAGTSKMNLAGNATLRSVSPDLAFIDPSLYALKASPAFTGTPTAPTASAGTNTTQIATTAYVVSEILARLGSLDVMRFRGTIDCSATPNYPAADAGDTYRVSVAGKIGGGSGPNVEIGDLLICITDSSSSGTHASVGANWSISQTNIDGAVTGPASSTNGNAATFSGTSGKVIQDSGKALPSGTIVGTTDTQTLTNKTLTAPVINSPTGLVKADVGLGNVDNTAVLGKQPLWIPAAAMTPRTTNGAAPGTVELASNRVMLRTLDFDASTQEFAQFAIRMPKQWNEGTVTFVPVWSHAATTTNFGVVWQLQGLALSDDDAADAAFGTAQTSTETGGTTNDIYHGPESPAITIGGTPAENDLVIFQVARVPANASDTMAIDARLLGITLFITTNAGTDA